MKTARIVDDLERAAARIEELLGPVTSASTHILSLKQEITAVEDAANNYKEKLRALLNAL